MPIGILDPAKAEIDFSKQKMGGGMAWILSNRLFEM